MSDASTRLGLPYLAPAQAQKHVTVNESLLRLDAVVQLAVVSATITAQPGAPVDGAVYILPAGKTGAAWGAMANNTLAYWRDGAWEQITPRDGWRAFVGDTQSLVIYSGGQWLKAWGPDERRMTFTPGGDGQVTAYIITTLRGQNPRTAQIASISGDTITLTSADAALFFGSLMTGCAWARIWNTSVTPNQPAWVKAAPASNQLQVINAAAIAGWAAGATLQVGDPTDITPVRSIALDISPLMQARIGRVFPQAGVSVRLLAIGSAAPVAVTVSGSGVAGSFIALWSNSDGAPRASTVIVACDKPSPVSNSNLIFVQEGATGTTLSNASVSLIGVWG